MFAPIKAKEDFSSVQMCCMFSLKEHTDSTIIALLFLVAINFLHIGQLLLPIICLYIFIDSKCKIKVNNWFTFILLCLFGISFFVFSYKAIP